MALSARDHVVHTLTTATIFPVTAMSSGSGWVKLSSPAPLTA